MVNIKKITSQLLGVKAKLLQQAREAINEASQEMINIAEPQSPIDTWDYNSSHKIINATVKSDIASWWIVNDSENAYGVEFGFQSGPVNRHRKTAPNQPYSQRPIIYNWVWANVYQRTKAQIIPKLKDIFIRKFGKW